MLGTDSDGGCGWNRWRAHHLKKEVAWLHSGRCTRHDGICRVWVGRGGGRGEGAAVLLPGNTFLHPLANRKEWVKDASSDRMWTDGLTGSTPNTWRGKAPVADGLHVRLSVCWGFGEWQQRCIMGQGEKASVRGVLGAGLAQEVWVEPKVTAGGEGGWVRVVVMRLLDDQLTVL